MSGAGPSADPVAVLSSLGKAVWGKGLPPGALVQVARESWKAAWRVMMSQLAPSDSSGAYQRTSSNFRETIRADHPIFVPEKGRYVLYAALSCPWAHRTLIVHRLKGLADVIPLCIARPGDSGLWEFAPASGATPSSAIPQDAPGTPGLGAGVLRPTPDTVNGCQTVKAVYQSQEGGYDGRATVPMIWDRKTKRVVNNESADIIRMLSSQFNEWAANASLDLAPPGLTEEMSAWDEEIYRNVNNGVYCCGFATTQAAYEEAVERLFSTLDRVDAHLACLRYLCGDALTLSDIRLFTTLVRFDAAYHALFKCSKQKIEEYPNIYGYLRELYQMDGIPETCDISGVGRSYFGSLFPLNPGGIVPAVPRSALPASLRQPHGRENVSESMAVL